MSRFALILLLLALSWSQVAIAAPSEHSQDVRPANETTELERREINGLWTTIYARWSTTALDQFRGNVEGELLIINIDVSSPFLKCQTPGQNHDMRCYCDDTMSVLVGDRPKYRYCDATFEIEPLVKGVVAEASPVGPLVPPPRPTWLLVRFSLEPIAGPESTRRRGEVMMPRLEGCQGSYGTGRGCENLVLWTTPFPNVVKSFK